MKYFTDGINTYRRDSDAVYKWNGESWERCRASFSDLCRFLINLEECEKPKEGRD